MDTKQNQKSPNPETEIEVVEIEFEPVPISAPPIEKTLEKVAQVLAQAKKAKAVRRHQCRSCRDDICKHFERVDLDTGEEFETSETGYIDRDGAGRR